MATTTKSRTYHGAAAVRKLRTMYGDAIIPEMEPLIAEEGYCATPYVDTKGVTTVGVGQTGVYSFMDFPTVYYHFRRKAAGTVEGFEALPERVRAAIVCATYRGSWIGSPKARKLFNEKRYAEAADEFLNSKEYRDAKASEVNTGVDERMERVADALRSMEDSSV